MIFSRLVHLRKRRRTPSESCPNEREDFNRIAPNFREIAGGEDRRRILLHTIQMQLRARWLVCILLFATFAIRAVDANQPIVENYVGRQIPTAMVARNLDRGSGFLSPQLDTAPFPNHFLVEPPIYEGFVIAAKRILGLELEASGRIVSALGMTLAALGLFALTLRREGERIAILAMAAFAVFPLTIRYGRAFQPDAAMLGAVLVGLAAWDRHRVSPSKFWLCLAWLAMSLGFAMKITSAFLLWPLAAVIVRPRTPGRVLAVVSTLVPAALWYAWASHTLGRGEGSLASADNRSIWLGMLGPVALFQPETLRFVFRFLLIRAFTPLGAILAALGLCAFNPHARRSDRLWLIWCAAAFVAMAALAGKLHHEYYLLVIAPVAAVGVGRAMERLTRDRQALLIPLVAAFAVVCWAQVRSTWRTPAEWASAQQAAAAVATAVPADQWVIAPEPLLFLADRRGCRMEWNKTAIQRAAGEWPGAHQVDDPLELIEFYRFQGARYFADLVTPETDAPRMALHAAVRRRYKVIVDGPNYLVADLADGEVHGNAN
jgi:4-amino-4-deoxy-L-arabinose transferase-like glycosyltransferase